MTRGGPNEIRRPLSPTRSRRRRQLRYAWRLLPEFRNHFFGEYLNLVSHNKQRGPQEDEMRHARLDEPFHALDRSLPAADNHPIARLVGRRLTHHRDPEERNPAAPSAGYRRALSSR